MRDESTLQRPAATRHIVLAGNRNLIDQLAGNPEGRCVRKRFQFSILTLMTTVAIAAVSLAMAVWLRNDEPSALLCVCAVVFFSPAWAPPILMYQRPSKVRRLFRGIILWTGLVTLPSCLGAATDRFPYQFESMAVLVGSYCLVLASGLGYVASRARFRHRNRRE